MGILSTLFGRSKLKRPSREQFFAIATTAVGLSARSDLNVTNFAGVVFNPVESSFFAELEREMDALLDASQREAGTRFEVKDDGFGTRWVILDDPDFEDLVTTIHIVGETITEHGFGDRLIAAVLRFDFEGKQAYWIYNIKRGKFYPLVMSGRSERDNAAEMRLGALMEEEKVPVEQNLENWYALWGIPF